MADIRLEIGWMGKCHICQQSRPVKFCSQCNHWFCRECRKNYFMRGIEAVRELIGGSTPGCCGVTEDVL